MNKAICFFTLCTAIALLSRDAAAMNGRHVTVSGGKMLLSTIQNSTVSGTPYVGSDQIESWQQQNA